MATERQEEADGDEQRGRGKALDSAACKVKTDNVRVSPQHLELKWLKWEAGWGG